MTDELGVIYSEDGKTLISAGMNRHELKGEYQVKEGTESIELYAFRDTLNLKSIILPDSLKSIGAGTFYWCNSLSNIKFPSKMEFIGAGAFNCCEKLNHIVLPDGITKLYELTFSYCV